MDEALDLHLQRNRVADLLDLLERKLTSQYDALRAHLDPEKRSLRIEDARLCADMKRHLRDDAVRHADDAEI